MKLRKNYNRTVHKQTNLYLPKLDITVTTECGKTSVHSGYSTDDWNKVTCKVCIEKHAQSLDSNL